MKKLLSIILTCAMIMSLFCVVPASATMISNSGLYAFENFEDGTSSITTREGSLEVVDADNGSAKAVKYTFASAADYPDLSIPSSTGLMSGFTTDMTTRATVRYKLGKALSAGYLTLVTVNSDATYHSTWEIPNLTDTTNWYTAEFEIANFAAADSRMFSLRVGKTDSTSATKAEDSGDVEIYLDDLQITREKATNKELITFSRNSYTSYLSDNLADTKGIEVDPLDSNNTALMATPGANGGSYNLLKIYGKGSNVTYKVGDTITVSCDVLVTGMNDARTTPLTVRSYPRDSANAYLSNKSGNSGPGSGYYTADYTVDNKGKWQTLTWSFDVTALGNGQYRPYFYISDEVNTDSTDGKKKDMGYYTFYFDNLTVNVSDRSGYIVPSVSDLTATMADGTVTPSYTYAETAVTGVTAGTDASLLKVKRTNGAVVASAVAGGTLVVPEAYRSESLTLEVTPVSSTGTFGDDVVTVAITAAEEENPIVGITFTATTTDATVVSADALTGIVIWAAYDANGKMTSCVSGDIEVDEQGTETISIPSGFVVDETVKVMLWRDMTTTCEPLADLVLID